MALQVELVAADRQVWSGEATMVRARTADGEIGIMAGHEPLLAILGSGEVVITAGGNGITAHVDGGFLSVDHDTVTLVAESVQVGGGSPATQSGH
ncbi:F-type H+-transporting ATPase subunit epsilon [Kineococcus xinjiangensis]|uniref:ATP synthase epsilon chain n=1 Tax=Kineococcus xinjiangensis TaxID=512762 RepID=A0A2S6IWJ8_9ACTN|nr:F0F1 ATP synthase subunit epsilon [Kineococcus xinjiangensis]PPK98656.1 F-type H+-transporting ATPase subunit epsilon [Kineococcus xinjiangensis]